MKEYTKDCLNKTKEYWNTYIKGGEDFPDYLPGMRPEILDSWKRCKSQGMKPDAPQANCLPKAEFEQILSENESLIQIAYPYLQGIYSFIRGSNGLIQLCDDNAYVIKALSDDQLIQELSILFSPRREGYSVKEKHIGTNSTHLALLLKRPVQVRDEEHFLEENHIFTCSSAPILGTTGHVVGCLTIVCPYDLNQSHTLGMVCAAVDGIQKEMRMQKAYDAISITNSILRTTIDTMTLGTIILDSNKDVLQHNKLATKLLQLPSSDIVGKNIYQILQRSSLPKDIQPFDTNLPNRELTVLNAYGKTADINLNVSTIRDENNNMQIIVLFIGSQKQFHHLANKISGYRASYTFDSIIGQSQAVSDLKYIGLNAAKSSSNVLILGESGTGKELLAHSIHNAGDRASGPFIAVNCGSLPKNLVESELFGYESGAFTGANKNGNPGKFELADGGTLFLDEIGDMPLELQVTLLRVLETHEITRLGAKYPKKIDVKVITATNTNLLEAVRQKNFRSDLYYRLNVLNITIPPLREREDDILLLAQSFMDTYNNSLGKSVSRISEDAQKILSTYEWPGNIRELENVIERGINLARNDTLSVNELPADLLNAVAAPLSPTYPSLQTVAIQNSLRKAEALSEDTLSPEIKEYNDLVRLIKQEKGHIKSVAQRLDIPVSTLYRKLNKFNINAKDYRKW